MKMDTIGWNLGLKADINQSQIFSTDWSIRDEKLKFTFENLRNHITKKIW